MLAAEGNIETNMSECQVFFAFFYLNGTSKKSIVHFNLVLPLAVVRVHTTFFPHCVIRARSDDRPHTAPPPPSEALQERE